ncbi:MAG: hypothetical protein JWR80_871 [Bradyrhizobium sp.]|nr:hypothetical protein [Bradyrhizobium sp.]
MTCRGAAQRAAPRAQSGTVCEHRSSRGGDIAIPIPMSGSSIADAAQISSRHDRALAVGVPAARCAGTAPTELGLRPISALSGNDPCREEAARATEWGGEVRVWGGGAFCVRAGGAMTLFALCFPATPNRPWRGRGAGVACCRSVLVPVSTGAEGAPDLVISCSRRRPNGKEGASHHPSSMSQPLWGRARPPRLPPGGTSFLRAARPALVRAAIGGGRAARTPPQRKGGF